MIKTYYHLIPDEPQHPVFTPKSDIPDIYEKWGEPYFSYDNRRDQGKVGSVTGRMVQMWSKPNACIVCKGQRRLHCYRDDHMRVTRQALKEIEHLPRYIHEDLGPVTV